jgi:hypothetical protein
VISQYHTQSAVSLTQANAFVNDFISVPSRAAVITRLHAGRRFYPGTLLQQDKSLHPRGHTERSEASRRPAAPFCSAQGGREVTFAGLWYQAIYGLKIERR